jgi:hypothetical protein
MEYSSSPFNSALETGIRTLAVLVASYPTAHDLGRLVQYDYLTVHSADAGGPSSLHPPLPLRSGELLVRRGLVQAGLRLMISRFLVSRAPHAQGILYQAEEAAGPFLDNMRAPYIVALRERAEWAASVFDPLEPAALDAMVNRLFKAWTVEFQPVQLATHGDLF